MRVIFTLQDLFGLGILAVALIVFLVTLLIAALDYYTRDWRYKYFKCPKCKYYSRRK